MIPCVEISISLATKFDRDGLLSINRERNPEAEESALIGMIDREIELNSSAEIYRLFVAKVKDEIVGFCRYYHSSKIPLSKIQFQEIEGIYAMGTVVRASVRRIGVARALHNYRVKDMSARSVTEYYSIVDSLNQASISMHKKFGYKEIGRFPGIFHIKFEDREVILYRYDLQPH